MPVVTRPSLTDKAKIGLINVVEKTKVDVLNASEKMKVRIIHAGEAIKVGLDNAGTKIVEIKANFVNEVHNRIIHREAEVAI